MQNSIWKLTALAGVIGLGFLIVLQMQGEIGQNQQAQNEVESPPPGAGGEETEPPINPADLALNEPPVQDQWEPPTEDPIFGSEPLPSSTFPATVSSEPSSDPFVDQPPFLSEPATNELPEAPPLLAEARDVAEEPARLPLFDDKPAVQLMSSEELVDPFESATEVTGEPLPEPAATLPEPAATLPDPQPLIDLPETEAPTGLFDSPPEFTSEPAAALPEPEISALPLGELSLPEVAEPEPLPTLELPETDTQTPPVTGLFEPLPTVTEPLPEAPKVADELPKPADETYLAEPELTSESLPLTPNETEPLPLPGTFPLADETLPEPEVEEPALTTEQPEEPPVLSSSTGEVITELTGDAELPARLPASAQQPELTIEKVAPKEATLGKPMIYSIIVSNRGVTNAAQVIVEDQVPKGCRLVGTIPQAELIGSKLLWRLGHLSAGSKKKILVKVIPVEEGQVGSIATVNFIAEVATKTDILPTSGESPATPPAALPTADASPLSAVEPVNTSKPEINVNISGPDKAQVGETVVLKFNIANDGTSPARDVALQDIIPVGFEHPAGNDLTYEVGYLDVGKSVDVELELVAVKPGTHTNQAVVTAAGNLRTESKKKVEVADARGLTLKIETSDARPIGEPAVLRFLVTNESSQPVSGATLKATLPAKSHFGSATEGGQFDKASRSIQWPLPAIAAGSTATVAAQVTPLDFGLQTTSVTLSQTDKDDQSADATIEALGVAALKIDLDNVPPTAIAGQEFTVDVTVKNRGNGADNNVVLALLLPEGIQFVGAKGPVKSESPQADTAGTRVSFTRIPEIGDQASVDFQITLRASSSGRHKLRAQISSDQLDAPLASDAAIVVLDSAL